MWTWPDADPDVLTKIKFVLIALTIGFTAIDWFAVLTPRWGKALKATTVFALIALLILEIWVNSLEQPRTITPRQHAAIVGALTGATISPIVVLTVEGDTEAQEYAQQIANALKAAGLKTTDATVVDKWPNLDPGGAHVAVADPTRPAIGATELQHALLKAGVAVDLILDPAMGSDRIQVLIGHDTR